MKSFLSVVILLSVFSFNSFAEDFQVKFCANDKIDHVTVTKTGNNVEIKYELTFDDQRETVIYQFPFILEHSVQGKDNFNILSLKSSRQIQSGTVYVLNKYGDEQRIIIAKDAQGDLVYFELFQTLAYFGTVNNCNKL